MLVQVLPARIADTLAPKRLGSSFRWLLSATVINNAGDGVAIAAGPLLVASQTRDPFLVSMALLSEFLPVLLFGVVGGVAADRFDRRQMVVAVNLVRALVLTALVAMIASGVVNIALVLVVLFVLGTAETFADSASSTLLPTVVAREDLGIANARMQGAFLLTNQLVAPPIGAFLFAAGMALPFAANAAAFALGAVLISRVAASIRNERGEGTSVRADLVEGIRWLVAHPPMRTLALTIFTFNVTYGAAWAVLVLYAVERLGMNEVGFGLLTTAIGVGGIVGIVSYGWLERRFSLGDHHARRVAHRDGDASLARADDVPRGRARHPGDLRCTCVRVGHDGDRRPAACRPERAPWPGRRRVPRGDRRRDRDRNAARWRPREQLRDHRPVLVRVRRLGAARRDPVAGVRPHRPRRRDVNADSSGCGRPEDERLHAGPLSDEPRNQLSRMAG